MIVRLDHIGIVARTIDEGLEVLNTKLGFSLDADATPLPDGAYFAPEGTHNYMIQVGSGETQIEILIPVVREAGTYKYLQRFGPGLHHWGFACDDVAAEAARLRAQGLRQIDLGVANPDRLAAAFFHPKTAGGILTERVPVRPPRR
jgi:methylmalonyl-CoA/ethylmalonyl-CoA epimerase